MLEGFGKTSVEMNSISLNSHFAKFSGLVVKLLHFFNR